MRIVAPIAVGGLLVVLLLAWALRSPEQPPDVPTVADTTAAAPQPQPPAHDVLPPPLAPRADRQGSAISDPPAEDIGNPDDADLNSEDMYDPLAQAWSNVDLEEVRRKMPGNLYFELASPTQDEAVLAERAAERARWNIEYGKMLSGTGSEEEIRAYYDMRARLSGDYVEFTTYLLDHHREELPERDVALLELARRMHLARLEEIPRQVEEAQERKRKQDEARAAWLADEAQFGEQ